MNRENPTFCCFNNVKFNRHLNLWPGNRIRGMSACSGTNKCFCINSTQEIRKFRGIWNFLNLVNLAARLFPSLVEIGLPHASGNYAILVRHQLASARNANDGAEPPQTLFVCSRYYPNNIILKKGSEGALGLVSAGCFWSLTGYVEIWRRNLANTLWNSLLGWSLAFSQSCHQSSLKFPVPFGWCSWLGLIILGLWYLLKKPRKKSFKGLF